MPNLDDMQILLCILEAVFLLLYISCEIRKSHYAETGAEIIDYHIDRGSLRHWISMMIVTYKYHQNGVEYIESEEVFVTRRRLSGMKACRIYVSPDNGRKFVTPFQISMWRALTLIFFVLLVMSALVSYCG